MLFSRLANTCPGEVREDEMIRSRLTVCVLMSLLLAPLAGVPPTRQRDIANTRLVSVWRSLTAGISREVRLTRGFQETNASAPLPPQTLLREVSEIERRALDYPSAQNLQDLGLLRLGQGHYTDAILLLQAASSQAVGDPKPASDLAAAYLARGQAEDRAFDLFLALDAADRALAVEPRLVEALFNRAEALTRLNLPSQARAAWQLLLAQEKTSRWSFHAGRRLHELAAPTAAQSWRIERPRLEAAALRQDARSVGEIVRRFPHLVRLDAEERILPGWAEARRVGDSKAAATWLSLAAQIGVALEEATGDAMILDAATAIARAREPNLAKLAEGLAAFGRGVQLFNLSRIKEARLLLTGAERALRESGNPFRGWAEFYGAVCDHYSDPKRAFRNFRELRRKTDERRYPVLAGRGVWLLGTIANNDGRPEEALRHYRMAFALISPRRHPAPWGGSEPGQGILRRPARAR